MNYILKFNCCLFKKEKKDKLAVKLVSPNFEVMNMDLWQSF